MCLAGFIVTCFLPMCSTSATPSAPPSIQALEPARSVTVRVKEGRPLATAVEDVSNRFGWIVTYEDPRMAYPGDAEDVTDKYARRPIPPGGHRTLVPRAGHYTFTGMVRPGLDGARAFLEELVADYNRQDFPGRFRVFQTGDVFHVVPVLVADAAGVLQPCESLLDTQITVASDRRSLNDFLKEIARGVTAATGVTLVVNGGANYLLRTVVSTGAYAEDARTVLLRALDTERIGATWHVLCEPGANGFCVLNVFPPTRR